jgi:hypothetical protein
MQNYDELIRHFTEQNAQLREENKRLKDCLDVALNTIALQQETIQQLKDEIAILKGQKPRPKIPPSTLEGPKDPDRQKNSTSRGKHPRHKKTSKLEIHVKTRIKPESIPEGAIFKGLQKVVVQDIILRPYNTVYALERWMLPDGTYLTGQLPQNIQGHYGPQVKAYILHQYYGCRVTGPLLLAQLKEIGILISEGQLSNILIQDKDTFHIEKDSLLLAGIAATEQIKVDDAGARHKGKNGYSNVIGNEFFTSIVTTESKSRINFLRILHGKNPRYLINEDAVNYIANLKPESWLLGYLLLHGTDQSMNQEEFNQFLMIVNITKESDVRMATEGALFASLIKNGVPKNLGVHGDDAGQFDAFVRSLCWIHEERHYRKLIPLNDEVREAIDEVRGELWTLYKGLKEYKLAPSEALRALLERKFEDLFLKKRTISRSLNEQLAKTYAKKEELLRVLERPETPLHNNPTETDAREMVVKKKVSGGTRSDEGRKCRDTFVSLKRTCIKLGINFLSYLNDRVVGAFDIPNLAQVIATRSSTQTKGPG